MQSRGRGTHTHASAQGADPESSHIQVAGGAGVVRRGHRHKLAPQHGPKCSRLQPGDIRLQPGDIRLQPGDAYGCSLETYERLLSSPGRRAALWSLPKVADFTAA